MGHEVEGFISTRHALQSATSGITNAHIVDLSNELALLLNTDDFFDELVQCAPDENPNNIFWKFHAKLEKLAVLISATSPVVYFETDYFGGPGVQAAAAWKDGKILFRPTKSDSISVSRDEPINSALRAIGVVHDPKQLDEFDTVGLGRFRDNEDWINQPPPVHKSRRPVGLLAKFWKRLNSS